MITWHVGVEEHTLLKDAAQWVTGVLSTLKSNLCESSVGALELINEVISNHDDSALQSMKIGGLLWEIGFLKYEGSEDDSIARASQQLWYIMQSSFQVDDRVKLDGQINELMEILLRTATTWDYSEG